MELLIAGGIALMGYSLSSPSEDAQPPRAPRPARRAVADLLGPDNEYRAPGNDTAPLTQAHVTAAEERWQAARDPAVSGIVTPHTRLTGGGMVPFFRSAKSQNTNDAVKQTRLETFTGANALDGSATGTWRPKQEVEAMFPPSAGAVPVTSGGSAGNQLNRGGETERYETSVMQNNVMPAPQVRVGRGVGVGPDVAATDGFHPMYRTMLKNVGEYKKNNLPGRVNHGGAAVSKTASQAKQPQVAVNRNPGGTVLDLENRPLLPTLAAVTAPAERPGQAPLRRPLLATEARSGNPALGAAGLVERVTGEARLGYECGADHPDRNRSLPPLNVAVAAAGVGGYTAFSVDDARLSSQQREMTTYDGGFAVGPSARQASPGFLLPPTQRDMTGASGYMGALGGGAAALGSAVHRQDEARHTLRETSDAGGAVLNPIAAVKGGTLDNVWRYNRLDRQAKRRHREHTPLPSRINVVDPEARGRTSLRPDQFQARQQFIPVLPSTYQDRPGSRTAPSNKLPAENPRLDLSLAVDQLRDNPYARSLWK